MVKIFIDPGHGGSDPGAVGNGLREKDLCLTISRDMRDMLAEYDGVQVRMSRTSDVFVGLSDRARQANAWGADYFVSIHINAGGGTGFESFIHTSRSSATVARQNTMHPEIIRRIGGADRGRKAANFAVLRETSMPAILTENLFIDRVADATKLKDRNFLRAVARGHADGIVRIFGLNKKAQPAPKEADDIEKIAVVINSYADFPAAEPVARREGAGIFLRHTATRRQVAKEIVLVGGSKDGIKGGVNVNLSGSNRFETAANVAKYLG